MNFWFCLHLAALSASLLAGPAAFAAEGVAAKAAKDAPKDARPAEAATSAAAPVEPPLDYTTLSHKLSIASLRAGSHDESGTNDYYFDVKMYALLNSSEERNAAFDARKKILVELGTFGDTRIDSLAVWKPDEKLKNYKDLKIDGNGIRELTARAMTELKVHEGDLTIMIEVALLEKHKKFWFFGDDIPVAKASYHPIPPTKFDTPLRSNQTLIISDDLGTQVRVNVEYAPVVASK